MLLWYATEGIICQLLRNIIYTVVDTKFAPTPNVSKLVGGVRKDIPRPFLNKNYYINVYQTFGANSISVLVHILHV